MSSQSVKHNLGLDANETAGHRSQDSKPFPREADQLSTEGEHTNKSHTTGGKEAQLQAEQHHDEHPKRRSIIDVLRHPSRTPSPGKTGEKKEKRKSISDSGPFLVEKNPETGHYITRTNPHWPEEDSWKREDVRSGKGDDKVVVPGGIGGVSYF